MTMATKKDIFKQHLKEYFKVGKQGKGAILTHVCFVTGLHRKAAVRKFKRLKLRGPTPPRRRGRASTYGPDVTVALTTVWEAGNEVCGELLHPVTNEYVDILERDGMWEHPPVVTQKLRAMSEATMKRRVATFRKARRQRKGISATKPSHLKQIVPIFTGPWKDKPRAGDRLIPSGTATRPQATPSARSITLMQRPASIFPAPSSTTANGPLARA